MEKDIKKAAEQSPEGDLSFVKIRGRRFSSQDQRFYVDQLYSLLQQVDSHHPIDPSCLKDKVSGTDQEARAYMWGQITQLHNFLPKSIVRAVYLKHAMDLIRE